MGFGKVLAVEGSVICILFRVRFFGFGRQRGEGDCRTGFFWFSR